MGAQTTGLEPGDCPRRAWGLYEKLSLVQTQWEPGSGGVPAPQPLRHSKYDYRAVQRGPAWDGSTLLEQTAARNRALEGEDGVRRHFAYDWTAGAAAVPAYGAYVAAERARLGEGHPLFQTQYALQAVAGTGRLFGPA